MALAQQSREVLEKILGCLGWRTWRVASEVCAGWHVSCKKLLRERQFRDAKCWWLYGISIGGSQGRFREHCEKYSGLADWAQGRFGVRSSRELEEFGCLPPVRADHGAEGICQRQSPRHRTGPRLRMAHDRLAS